MELDMIGIGERIKTRRKELKLSQTDIYERCDITSGALSKIENGKTTPSVIAFYKLSQVLECDMNWLATGISSNMQKSVCLINNHISCFIFCMQAVIHQNIPVTCCRFHC